MKYLLILLLISNYCWGQVKVYHNKLAPLHLKAPDSKIPKTKIDTIPCYLLVTNKSEFDYSVVSEVYSIKGYAVRGDWWEVDRVYLDSNKKPLDKNIIVWISRTETK